MDAQYPNINVMMDGNYFDITHSFKVDSSTYHVLGLRKDRPTYGNRYYIFNCGCEGSQSARYDSRNLPFIHRSRQSVYQSFSHTHSHMTVAHDLATKHRHETTSVGDQRRVRTASTKKVIDDTATIKQTLVDILKIEHKSLVSSFREEISAEKNTLLRSIEKETKIVTQATTAANNQKQEAFRVLEEKISTLESIHEKHASSIIASIELLKSTVSEALNTHHEQLQSLDQLQLALSKMIEREVEQVMMKHLETYRSTSTDISTIKQLQTTLIETFEKRSTTKKDDNNDALKYLLAEQTQNLTSLITKNQQTYSLDSSTIKQLQSTIIEIMEKSIKKKRDNNDTDVLNRLFAEQRHYLTELITKQQQAFSLDLIKETVISTLKEQTSTVITTTTDSVDLTHTQHPFKIAIKTAEFARIYATLFVDGVECSRELHTLCQRDAIQTDVVNCFVSPPTGNKPLKLTIYAKTNIENEYRAALCIEMPSKWPKKL